MEFCEKLQELRKQNKITQEELARALYVSRTAVSKWESGRGVPNIESLKAISKYFSVSIDDLLSGEKILEIAENDAEKKKAHICDLVFGLLDCAWLMLLFLPFFAQRSGDTVKSVSLLSLAEIAPYIKIPHIAVVSATVLIGVLTLALQNCGAKIWLKCKYKISVVISAAGAAWFTLTLQPYAALFAFLFLAIKSLVLINRR